MLNLISILSKTTNVFKLDDGYFIPIINTDDSKSKEIKFIDVISAFNNNIISSRNIRIKSMNTFTFDNPTDFFILLPMGCVLKGKNTQDRVIFENIIIEPNSKITFNKALCGNQSASINGDLAESSVFLPITIESGNPLLNQNRVSSGNIENQFRMIEEYSRIEDHLTNKSIKIKKEFERILQVIQELMQRFDLKIRKNQGDILSVSLNIFKIELTLRTTENKLFFEFPRLTKDEFIKYNSNVKTLTQDMQKISKHIKDLQTRCMDQLKLTQEISKVHSLFDSLEKLSIEIGVIDRVLLLFNERNFKELKSLEKLLHELAEINIDKTIKNLYEIIHSLEFTPDRLINRSRDNFISSNRSNIQSAFWKWIKELPEKSSSSIYQIIENYNKEIQFDLPNSEPNEIGLLLITLSGQYNLVAFPTSRSWDLFRPYFIKSYLISQKIKREKNIKNINLQYTQEVLNDIALNLSLSKKKENFKKSSRLKYFIYTNQEFYGSEIYFDSKENKRKELRPIDFLFASIQGFYKEPLERK